MEQIQELSDQKFTGEEADVVLAKAAVGSRAPSRLKISSDEPRRVSEEIESEPEGHLTIDVYQTPSEIVIESAIAGVAPEDLDIDVTTDSVTVKGKRHREKSVKEEDYFYRECYWGRFSRSVILPQEVDADASAATFKNGILTIRLPKLRRERSKKLRVKQD
ncbi:MAG: Hsp20/alpha crystallin family protein [Candidatus Liptonbacteria bacterium]|nr:Hsp20/alpha crystallin family protein [Candidatus Liptonbacteria bacterium]